jgi:integrase
MFTTILYSVAHGLFDEYTRDQNHARLLLEGFTMKKSRWAYLLEEDDDFRRWYRNTAMGSEYTAKERARVLYRFLVRYDMTPTSLAEYAKRDVRKMEDLLMDFVAELHQEGRAPSYITSYLTSVKSWLNFHGVRLVRRIKVGNTNLTPTIEDERIPTPSELLQILSYTGSRGKCSMALIAFSGLRPQVLGDLTGRNGLEIRDFPEIKIEGKSVTFTKMPTRVNVRATLSKAKHKYFSFLSEEGCDYLRAYLERRLANGEELKSDSAIISIKIGHENTGFRKNLGNFSTHITTKTITKEIRDAMRPNFMWRPYVLRSYFDTQLLVAENNGKISHSYRQFFMGHVGDMEARYTTNKGRLPEAVIEDMRRTYINSQEYLSTTRSRGEDPELTTIRTMVESGVLDLSKSNVKDYLISKLGLGDVSNKIEKTVLEQGVTEEVAMNTLIFDRLGIKPSDVPKVRKVKNSTKKVSEDELLEYLDDGWVIHAPLPSGSIVIKKFTYL